MSPRIDRPTPIPLPESEGGTGETAYDDGELLIGNTSTQELDKATLTEGEGIDITNGTGSITISGEDATTTNKGIASFVSADFVVSSGAVSLVDRVVTTIRADSGSAIGSGHTINFNGGRGIDVTATDATVTIDGEQASTTNEGVVELATIAETNTGTSALLAVTPDGLDGWTGSAQVTTLGTIATGTWQGTTIALNQGGTGQTTNTAAFDALAPTTTTGDIIYHDGVDNVRLPIGTNGQQLKVTSGIPDWFTPTSPAPVGWDDVLGVSRISNGTNPQLTTTDRFEVRDASNYFFSSATNITNMVTAGSFRMGTTVNYASVDSTGVLTFAGTGGYGVAINVPAFFVSIAVLAGITFATVGGNRIKTTDTLGADLSASWLGGGALGGNGGFHSTHGFARGETVVAQITANINNTLIFADTGFAIITSDAARNVTGAGRPNNTGILSRETHIHNNGAFAITFTDQDAASTATNRFQNVTVPGANMVLAAGEGLMIQYSPSIGRWLMEKK